MVVAITTERHSNSKHTCRERNKRETDPQTLLIDTSQSVLSEPSPFLLCSARSSEQKFRTFACFRRQAWSSECEYMSEYFVLWTN